MIQFQNRRISRSVNGFSPFRDVHELFNHLVAVADFSLNNIELYSFWIRLLKDLLNPGYALYTSSLMEISDKDLPLYYLFRNARVLYKNKPYSVYGVNQKEIDIVDPGAGNRVLTVHLDDTALTIPEPLFSDNYNHWVSSISIGEEVDFYVDNDNYHCWCRGIVEDILFDGEELRAMTIRTCFRSGNNTHDYHQTIHGFSIKSLNRPFSRSSTPSPALHPYRYAFERNQLIPNTNHKVHYNKVDTVCNENGMIYPPLYIFVVNLITINNIWHKIASNMDVSTKCLYYIGI